jgi:hypothetical protein
VLNGAYGERGMLDVLKIVRRQERSLGTTWSNRSLVELWRIISHFCNFFEFVDFCSSFSM